MKQSVIALLILVVPILGVGQDVVINEIVSSNNTVVQDIDGDFSDWVELLNLRNYDIDLAGYTISDDRNSVDKWVFPSVTIPADSFILIFASGKDKFQNGELHTNFKIKQSGEPVVLRNDQGEVQSDIDGRYIPSDRSLARIADTSEVMIITSLTTPNASNTFNGGVYCDHPSGFYDTVFNLELASTNNAQQIYYTLNGGVPTANSELYSDPIPIDDNTQSAYSFSEIPTTPLAGPYPLSTFIWKEPDSVYKCNVVRFAAFENGIRQGDVHTKSYFIDPGIGDRYEWPVVSLVTDSSNLFDHDTGIYIPGQRFDDNGFNWWPEGNYHNRGEQWERDLHISYFENDGNVVFETDASMRMRGYGSASNPQKSFNLYFRSEYGRSNISYPIFMNSTAEKYKRLIFRNSGNDFIYSHFKDPMLQDLISSMDLELQDLRPAIVFINGEYWGIHNIREKYDKYYFKYKYGIAEDEINILNHCGGIEEGQNDDYLDLEIFIEQNDLSIGSNYSFVRDRLDIDNFIDLQIAEIYFANYDWPCNNVKIWKENAPNSKWRYLIHDLDYSFGYDESSTYSTASMAHATSLNDWWPHCLCSNLFFRSLLNNSDFRARFLSRFQELLSTTFCVEEVVQKIDEFESLYVNEVEEHIGRWGYPASVANWKNEVEILREFARKRPAYMAEEIMAYFNLADLEYGECFDDNVFETDRELIVYPNPNAGQFAVINNSSADMENAKATLINSVGQTVFVQEGISIAVDSRTRFNIQGLTEGIYLLIVESGGDRAIQKVDITSNSNAN